MGSRVYRCWSHFGFSLAGFWKAFDELQYFGKLRPPTTWSHEFQICSMYCYHSGYVSHDSDCVTFMYQHERVDGRH